jgi:ribonucleoside-diphosphate reductase alpha chain
VTKRNGTLEPVDLEKIHRVISWAAEGLNNVSVSQVELKAHVQLFEGIPTADIHDVLTKAAADLISASTPDYQYLSARLAIFHLRKRAFGTFTPPTLMNHVQKLVGMGKYDPEMLSAFDGIEMNLIDEMIDHKRDMKFAYAAIKQFEGKYLVQNRVKDIIYESPQFAYIGIAMSLFGRYPKATRLDYIRKFYNAVSNFKISLPTPIMSGVRTPTRQFSSCILIEAGDSLDEINAASSAIVKYVSQRAGIGLNAGMIRSLGSEIRGGEAFHTGIIPFLKHFQTAVKSCSQGGVRGGAATVFYPMWTLESPELFVLKNNRGVDENRVRHLDYGIQFNKLMYQRLISNDNITLFSPSDVPGLYDAFFADQEEFERLYTKYEADESIRKKVVKAFDHFAAYAQERAGTGRLYLQNVDHCNTHSPFDPKQAPIKQSNLCLEIALPTKPMQEINDPNGEIAMCTLSAFNLGAIDSLDELEDLADIGVRALDSLLDYQDYLLPAARVGGQDRRALGFGIINYAYDLARKGMFYSDGSANDYTHRMMEAIQFNLLKASNNLAKEQGACKLFHETSYSQGILPIDTYSKEIDNITKEELHCDWETLRGDILEHGLRNSTVMALMPSETSSQISNATNGIEPPRGLVSVKASKDGIFKQVVPEIEKLRGQYELLWNMPSNTGYLHLVGIMQKFVDQTISCNTNYDPDKYPGGKVPMKLILKDILTAYKLGIKTMYYHQTRDGQADAGQEEVIEVEDENCASGACKI